MVYAGPKLASRQRYYWTVRVWDAGDKPSAWAEPAWWEMGLLDNGDWTAKWIRWQNPEQDADRSGIRWIWHPDQNARSVPPRTGCIFRLNPALKDKPRDAALFILAKGNFTATVNGHDAGRKSDWHAFDRREITGLLVPGKNSIEVTVTVSPLPTWKPDSGTSPPQPAGLAGLLKIVHADGTVERIPTSSTWQAQLSNETEAKPAKENESLGEFTQLPQPAALLRHEFDVTRTVRRARIYVTALGSYQLSLNGQRVGDGVLTPDFTDYRKRVLYQTFDVTPLLKNGRNALGAILGDGWFASPLTWRGLHFFSPERGLLAQMEIEYADGSRQTMVTDPSWTTAPSAIVESSIYGGETYDARLEQPGWDKPGFDDSGWPPAIELNAPSILVSSQMSAPVQMSQTLQPKSVTRDAHGAWIFDMGQNMVGWAALRVKGLAGTKVQLRFAEILNSDGTIYRDNLRNADATDIYTLRGGDVEAFRPHFTFHGFRYVEVTGYPGTPTLRDLTGEVVNSLTGGPTGTIETSSDLVNRMWSIGPAREFPERAYRLPAARRASRLDGRRGRVLAHRHLQFRHRGFFPEMDARRGRCANASRCVHQRLPERAAGGCRGCSGLGRRGRHRTVDLLDAIRRRGDRRRKLGCNAALDAIHPGRQSGFPPQEPARTEFRRLARARQSHAGASDRHRILGHAGAHDGADGARHRQRGRCEAV
jgi:alpha-L-rhamnosidase